MQTEIVLFWVVATGFLIADNLVLLPKGCDWLRFGRRGLWVYEPGTRLEARGRDLVMLNPLNLFDRAAVTTCSLGPLSPKSYRMGRRQLHRALPLLNFFSWLGYAYLACAVALASTSFAMAFGSVLVSFLAVHLLFASIAAVAVVLKGKAIGLSSYQRLIFVVEGLLVPAYTINLGKRLWTKTILDLPAMNIGIRQAKRLHDERDKELFALQLQERVKLMEDVGAVQTVPESLAQDKLQPRSVDLLQEVKACLLQA